MQPLKTKKARRKFGINPAYYQTPIVVVIAFLLGYVGNKLVGQLYYIYCMAGTIPGHLFSDLNWRNGWDASVKNGVQPVTFIIEGIAIGIFVAILWFISSYGAKKAEERNKARDAKLDGLPQKIADAIAEVLMSALGKQPSCPNGCKTTQAGFKYCGQCGSRLIWK